MKTSKSLLPLLLVTFGVLSIADGEELNQNETDGQLPMACNLSGSEFDKRTTSVFHLLKQTEEISEVEDGYSLRFPGDGEWADLLFEFIKSERECCNFIKFGITFEPNSGPIWLYVGGSPEVKAFIHTLVELE